MTARVFSDVVQLVAALAAVAVCLIVARHRTGAPRRWRLLAAVGLAGFGSVRLWWLVQDLTLPERPPASVADVGFLILPVCVLLALLGAPYTRPRPVPTSARRDQLALLIDSVLIAGSLLALAWSLIPAEAMHWDGLAPSAIGVSAAYVIADLVLVTMVVLLLTTRPDARAGRRPLGFAGLGLIALAVSDTLRLIHLADGPLNLLQSTGYVLGPAFVALAALTPRGSARPPATPAVSTERDWVHLLLPYLPVSATGVVLATRTPLSPFEAYLGWLGLGLVVARQMFTIVDNTVLLDRVSEGRRRLHHQAYHDPLTGLANRALFRERLVQALDAHEKQGTPVALLFADLDDFKLINDGFGHAMGDRVLRAIADRLRQSVAGDGIGGGGDLVARLGGDEFAVILVHRAAEAEPIGHRILAALREPFFIDGHRIGVGASIGLVAPEPGEPLTADALLRRADAAMYSSKRRGKGALARYAGPADGNADLPHLLAQ
ncbi:MAG: GGDEF domain-containing protein, partial [Actinoplanes sp.]